MPDHQLIKQNGWFCEVCQWTWRGKPRSQCPGVRRYKEMPRHLWDQRRLERQNLKPKGSPIGCIEATNKSWIWLYDPDDTEQLYDYPEFNGTLNDRSVLKTAEEIKAMNRTIEGANVRMMCWNRGLDRWDLLYHLDDCPIADSALPTIYTWNNRPNHLETPHNLQKFNLKPGPDAIPKGCVWNDRAKDWTYLYDPKGGGLEILDLTLPPCYSRVAVPNELKTKEQLKLLNFKLNETVQPKGCYRVWEKCSTYDWELVTVMLYHVEDCSIIDPSLPPCYEINHYPVELKTERELEELSLAPGDAASRGCLRQYVYGSIETTLLYHPDDCVWHAKDHFICKTTLSRTYLLSKNWIKRLGEPDRIVDNPHHEKWSSMQLFSRQRVENFLAENAEEYARWLSERDRYITIFEQNREAIEAGRQRRRQNRVTELQQRLEEIAERDRQIEQMRQESTERWRSSEAKREQMVRCLQCASGLATQQGFCCVIHPLGLEDDQLPCPDWMKR